MNQRTKTYLGLGAVFCLSFFAAKTLPIDEIFKGVAATPAVAALLGVIYQIFRNQASFEKSKYLLRRQQVFSFAGTSHMAKIAFDRHVEFCEKYMEEVHLTVSTFFRDGPTNKAMDHAATFDEIRRRYSAWIPKETALQLEPFENAVRKIGALHHLVEELVRQDTKGRNSAITEMYETFKQVMQLKGVEPTADSEEVAIEEVKQRVRSVLGIDELTQMRKLLMREALAFLKDDA